MFAPVITDAALLRVLFACGSTAQRHKPRAFSAGCLLADKLLYFPLFAARLLQFGRCVIRNEEGCGAAALGVYYFQRLRLRGYRYALYVRLGYNVLKHGGYKLGLQQKALQLKKLKLAQPAAFKVHNAPADILHGHHKPLKPAVFKAERG